MNGQTDVGETKLVHVNNLQYSYNNNVSTVKNWGKLKKQNVRQKNVSSYLISAFNVSRGNLGWLLKKINLILYSLSLET